MKRPYPVLKYAKVGEINTRSLDAAFDVLLDHVFVETSRNHAHTMPTSPIGNYGQLGATYKHGISHTGRGCEVSASASTHGRALAPERQSSRLQARRRKNGAVADSQE